MVWIWKKEDKIFRYKMDDSIILKLYPDNRPHYLETSDLQKGIVLELNGAEIIGEGMGFGAPVIKFKDKTFFSGTSACFIDENNPSIIKKIFSLDMVSKKYFKDGQISDKVYRPIHKIFTFFYLRFRSLRFFFDKLMNIRENAGIKTIFVKTEPRGKVMITYQLRNDEIIIDADFSGLDITNCKEIVILNEQGASFFNVYGDSDGVDLSFDKIGAWEKVNAAYSHFTNMNTNLSFILKDVSDASLFRGWENVPGRLSWAGLNYSINPEIGSFTYTIEIKRTRISV
jgi:hypothetical protein